MSARQPFAQLSGGIVGSAPVEGHQCGGNAREFDNLRSPAIIGDTGHLDGVLAPRDDCVKAL